MGPSYRRSINSKQQHHSQSREVTIDISSSMKRSLPLNNNDRQQKRPKPSPRREATIDDLPDELLGLIFRQLPPWLHRVRVEGVSKRFQRVALAHGWADVREFSTETNEFNRPTWSLLSRVGPHLTTLELGRNFANRNSAEDQRVELEKCPRVKHLSVYWELLDPPTILEHIGRAYATTLKSLRIYSYDTVSSVKDVRGLSEALNSLTALESLELLDCKKEAFILELHLSAQSLANLRHLTLYVKGQGCILSEENIDVLVALPRLRSITLGAFQEFSFLKRFSHLENLYISGIGDESIDSLIKALPHLGRTLKALGLLGYHNSPMSLPSFERFLAALTEHLPLLEHLALSNELKTKQKVSPLLQKCLLDPLASSPHLQNVRSLSLGGHLEPLSWAWLEGMSQRLEYLELGEMPPLSTLCSIVGKCKNLRGLFLWRTELSAADRKLLVEASLGPQNTASTSDDEEKVIQPKLILPTLHIGFSANYTIRDELKSDNFTDDSRVRFSVTWNMRSHVLELYRFGCLSEGQHSFNWH